MLQPAWIGLGSNLNGPNEQLDSCIQSLSNHPRLQLIAQSLRYISKPLGPSDQPDFINMAVHIQTDLAPLELLKALQAIEQRQRRQRLRHWGERTLDADLLLYGDLGQTIIQTPVLTVPHPHLTQRDFVLQPLIDLVGQDFVIDGQNLRTHLAQCADYFIIDSAERI